MRQAVDVNCAPTNMRTVVVRILQHSRDSDLAARPGGKHVGARGLRVKLDPLAMSTILSVRNLTVNLEGRRILASLSFEVHAGDLLAIIGPNGSGKTVLLRTLLHLLPYQGAIEWSHDARIGYVPQKVTADRQLPLHVNDLLNAKAHFLKLTHAEVER